VRSVKARGEVQVTYLFDDVGIPADYRHMNGSSVNTYSLINSTGAVTLVKFQWKPVLGGWRMTTISVIDIQWFRYVSMAPLPQCVWQQNRVGL
jgi:catalase